MRRYVPYVPVGLFVAAVVAAHFSGVTDVFGPEAGLAKRQAVLAPLAFAAAYLAVAALALPVAAILSYRGLPDRGLAQDVAFS